MFIRKLRNRSGSTSVQVISKARGRYKVHKTVGCAITQHEIDKLVLLAKQEIDTYSKQFGLFTSDRDTVVEEAIAYLSNADIRTAALRPHPGPLLRGEGAHCTWVMHYDSPGG